MKRKLLILLLLSVIYRCNKLVSSNTNVGQETTNGIIVTLVDGNGFVSDANFSLLPLDFNPISEQIPDSNVKVSENLNSKEYRLSSAKSGVYNLFVTSKKTGKTAYVDSVSFSESRLAKKLEIALKKPGAIRVSFDSVIISSRGSIYIPGTPFGKKISSVDSSAGFLVLESIAPGIYDRFKILKSDADTSANTISKPILIRESDTTQIQNKSFIDAGFTPKLFTSIVDSLPLWEFEGELQSLLKGHVFPKTDDSSGIWVGEQLLVPNNSYHGKSLKILPGTTYKFWLANGYVNLSKMKALSLYAKGNGLLSVAFQTYLVQAGEGNFNAQVNVPATWNPLNVESSSILPQPGSLSDSLGRTWADGNTKVSAITLRCQTDTIYIDDIFIRGMTYSNFLE